MSDLTDSSTWQELKQHHDRLLNVSLSDLFKEDEVRASSFSRSVADLSIDFSKNLIDQDVVDCLLKLANESDLKNKISAMFRGDKINFTEHRAVLHTALRDISDQPVFVDGVNVKPQVQAVLGRMTKLANLINNRQLNGATGKIIKNIINIGIGGSDLGPASAYLALKDYTNKDLVVRFVSNVDYSDFYNAVVDLDPAETLFIISSKTFTTEETMTNTQSARLWIVDALGESAIEKHFIAVSTNKTAVELFGINLNNMFEFWDWVGGRYSLCSAIGLSLMIAIGSDNFYAMLGGFNKMDQHFFNSSFDTNLPVLLALISIWYGNFWQTQTSAIIPYSYNLARLPAYLQQAVMESNGKSVDINGNLVDYQTSPIIWGEPGTNAQHAFFQLLHQGTILVPVDFIGFIKANNKDNKIHHDKLMANMIAQAEALAFGEKQSLSQGDDLSSRHQMFTGNKPSTFILGKKLTPEIFGELIAMYEHKIFTEGIIWGINSFDQFGVELGKKLAKNIYQEIISDSLLSNHDASTVSLIKKMKDV